MVSNLQENARETTFLEVEFYQKFGNFVLLGSRRRGRGFKKSHISNFFHHFNKRAWGERGMNFWSMVIFTIWVPTALLKEKRYNFYNMSRYLPVRFFRSIIPNFWLIWDLDLRGDEFLMQSFLQYRNRLLGLGGHWFQISGQFYFWTAG